MTPFVTWMSYSILHHGISCNIASWTSFFYQMLSVHYPNHIPFHKVNKGTMLPRGYFPRSAPTPNHGQISAMVPKTHLNTRTMLHHGHRPLIQTDPDDFHYNAFALLCNLYVFYLQESSSSGSECETAKGKLFPDNPFICRTPSATMVDMKGSVLCPLGNLQ